MVAHDQLQGFKTGGSYDDHNGDGSDAESISHVVVSVGTTATTTSTATSASTTTTTTTTTIPTTATTEQVCVHTGSLDLESVSLLPLLTLSVLLLRQSQ